MSLPAPLMTSDPGSFARATIVERKPTLIGQVLEANQYPEEAVARLNQFREEISKLPVKPLVEKALDVPLWNSELTQYTGKTWLDIPWYFAETFFYRKLLEAVHYFQPGAWFGKDPFWSQKANLMATDVHRLSSEWTLLEKLPVDSAMNILLQSCLWGNRTDLSNFSVQEQGRGGVGTISELGNILIDDTESVIDYLQKGVLRLDFITDNVGADILFDLALTRHLLEAGKVQRVVMHLKNQPFFVSDAMPQDVLFLVNLLQEGKETAGRTLGLKLKEYIVTGRLSLMTDPFWTSYLMFRQMPIHLHRELGRSDLVIIKGDVNYRRILDDLHWPFTARIEEIAAYFPAPFVALRTLKGEIMVGLQPGEAEKFSKEDPSWLINGKRGVIQFVNIIE